MESQALPETVGPGSYDPMKKSPTGKAANSVFTSRVERELGLDPVARKAASHQRIQSKNLLKTQPEGIDEEEDEDWEVYATPGPGYYNTNLTAFKKKKIP